MSAPATTLRTATSTRRPRTSTRRSAHSSTLTPTPTVAPYDANAERHADSQRTNKILIGVFTGIGVIFLGLIAFQLLRCYKRRRHAKSVSLPPPRDPMAQVGYRQSRAVSMYKDYPTPGISRPQSTVFRDGSASGFFATPSVGSTAPSMERLKADESGRLSTDLIRSPFQAPHEDSPDNSRAGSAIIPTDEEIGLRSSPLGSRSQSPSNPSMPRRPESRARYPRPNSVASTARHSHLNTPNWQNRSSMHGSARPGSYYASGNHGAPHTQHARERVGLVMPQPLAPELFNYALGGRHDMGLDFTQGAWGSGQHLANGQDLNPPLAAPMRTRTDSWVGNSHIPSNSPSASDEPVPPPKDQSIPRGRSSRPEIPRP